MQTQNTKLDFSGQTIYAGIDVHLKNWRITLETDKLSLKTFMQEPDPAVLNNFLRRNYPGATYKCVYEAGFSGFAAYDKFTEFGIDCIVVNPADVPTKDKEKKHKNDVIDSRKLARCLRNNELEGIYVHPVENREYRSLIRCRKKLARDLTRYKNRIKSFLYFHGIEIPVTLVATSKYWPKRFTEWLKTVKLKTDASSVTLGAYIEQAQATRRNILNITRGIRKLSQSDIFKESLPLLTSISGIGPTSGMIILTELGDIKRFKNFDKLNSYVGLICTTYSSGDKEKVGEMTKRGNHLLKETLVECSWVAIRQDPALLMAYQQYIKRMEPNKAIIRIARKLLNRIRFVLENKKPYETTVVK
jgi:transposase